MRKNDNGNGKIGAKQKIQCKIYSIWLSQKIIMFPHRSHFIFSTLKSFFPRFQTPRRIHLPLPPAHNNNSHNNNHLPTRNNNPIPSSRFSARNRLRLDLRPLRSCRPALARPAQPVRDILALPALPHRRPGPLRPSDPTPWWPPWRCSNASSGWRTWKVVRNLILLQILEFWEKSFVQYRNVSIQMQDYSNESLFLGDGFKLICNKINLRMAEIFSDFCRRWVFYY